MSRCYSRLAKASLVAVAMALILDCAALWSDISVGRTIVDGGAVAPADLDRSATLSSLANIAVLITIIGAASVFLWWFQCSYRRMALFRATRQQPLEFDPDSALTVWFTPGPNVIRPPKMMMELTERAQLVSIWWAFGLAGGLTHLVLRLIRPDTQQGWINWQVIALLANVLLLVSLACVISLISTVSKLALRSARFSVHPTRYRQA